MGLKENSLPVLGIIMSEFLNDLPLLVEVARQKSFTKAADVLGIGASTLSRRIRQLEERMGVPLFYRDTRNVELTEHGARLVERCEFIVEEARKAQDSLLMEVQKPSGLIRVCIFRDMCDLRMREALVDFAKRWTDIQLELSFQEQQVDLRTAPYDVAFLIGPSIAQPLVARKLITIEPFLYASPELLERHPVPREPKDLLRLPCIVLGRFGRRWPMHNGKRHVVVDVQPRYTFSSVEMCRDFALAGLGVALLRGLQVEPDEQAGRLVRLLPEWSGGFGHDVNIVTGSGQLPRRVRVFVEHMQALFGSFKES
jgi:DNA-binding transcriptional LysR family regulator